MKFLIDDDAEMMREFFTRRPWLHGRGAVITDDDYQSMKARDRCFWENIHELRRAYLRGFVDGWLRSKQ